MQGTDWIVLLAGSLAGLVLWQVYRVLPAGWLVEFGETDIPPELSPQLRTRFQPDGLIMMAISAILALTGWRRFSTPRELALFAAASAVLLLIAVADWKTRIIPDPLTAACAIIGLLTVWSDAAQNSWPARRVILRLLAGVGVGLILFLIGWIGSRIARQEAMGMGDIKLIIPCVWLADYSMAVSLIFLAFLTAAFFAVPLLIRKYRSSPAGEPVDGALAFGPFIVLATWLVLLLKPEILAFWQYYFRQFQ
jgi:leader peptidase (prepilin peptidase)/N-methyltransferase